MTRCHNALLAGRCQIYHVVFICVHSSSDYSRLVQLFDIGSCDIQNNQSRGRGYQPKPKAQQKIKHGRHVFAFSLTALFRPVLLHFLVFAYFAQAGIVS